MTNKDEYKNFLDLPYDNCKTMNASNFIKDRLQPWYNFYDKKAKRAKFLYLFMTSIIIIGGTTVPVLINIEEAKVLTTVISLTVAILVSLEGLFHFREQWKNYRSTEQLLAREYLYFVTGSEPYDEAEEDLFKKFVHRIEAFIESENNTTLEVKTSVISEKMRSELKNIAVHNKAISAGAKSGAAE